MSSHDGCYVKTSLSNAFWAVDNGKRRIMESMKEVYKIGLRPVHVISPKELREIPLYNIPNRKPTPEFDPSSATGENKEKRSQ